MFKVGQIFVAVSSTTFVKMENGVEVSEKPTHNFKVVKVSDKSVWFESVFGGATHRKKIQLNGIYDMGTYIHGYEYYHAYIDVNDEVNKQDEVVDYSTLTDNDLHDIVLSQLDNINDDLIETCLNNEFMGYGKYVLVDTNEFMDVTPALAEYNRRFGVDEIFCLIYRHLSNIKTHVEYDSFDDTMYIVKVEPVQDDDVESVEPVAEVESVEPVAEVEKAEPVAEVEKAEPVAEVENEFMNISAYKLNNIYDLIEHCEHFMTKRELLSCVSKQFNISLDCTVEIYNQFMDNLYLDKAENPEPVQEVEYIEKNSVFKVGYVYTGSDKVQYLVTNRGLNTIDIVSITNDFKAYDMPIVTDIYDNEYVNILYSNLIGTISSINLKYTEKNFKRTLYDFVNNNFYGNEVYDKYDEKDVKRVLNMLYGKIID